MAVAPAPSRSTTVLLRAAALPSAGSLVAAIVAGARLGAAALLAVLLSSLVAPVARAVDRAGGTVVAAAGLLIGDLTGLLAAAVGLSLLLGVSVSAAGLLAALGFLVIFVAARRRWAAFHLVLAALLAVIAAACVAELPLIHAGAAWVSRQPAPGGLIRGLALALALFGAIVHPQVLARTGGSQPPNPAISWALAAGACLVSMSVTIGSAVMLGRRGTVLTSLDQGHQILTPLFGGASEVAFAIALIIAGAGAGAATALTWLWDGGRGYALRAATLVIALVILVLRVDLLGSLIGLQALLGLTILLRMASPSDARRAATVPA